MEFILTILLLPTPVFCNQFILETGSSMYSSATCIPYDELSEMQVRSMIVHDSDGLIQGIKEDETTVVYTKKDLLNDLDNPAK